MNSATRQAATIGLAGGHILAIQLIFSEQLYKNIPPDLTFRLNRVFSTGILPGGPADMMVLFFAGSLFYVGYALLLRGVNDKKSVKTLLIVMVSAAVVLNVLLLSMTHMVVGGDVERNFSFAAAALKGYNPYSITGYDLNKLIEAGNVNAPLVREYLDHRQDYPPITLLYYSVVLFLTGDFARAYTLAEVGLTVVRLLGALLIYRICHLQKVAYLLPVGLYLMNPVMIYYPHDGKEDALLVTLSLLSIYLVSREKVIGSGVTLALSTLAKYVSVVYWPILALYTRRVRSGVLLSVSYLTSVVVTSAPFLIGSPYVFSFVFWQLARPCNSLLNITCYDPSHPLSIIRLAAAVAYLGVFSVLAISYRAERGFFRMTTLVTAATLLVVMLGRSFFIWYLDWLSVSVYFSQKNKMFHYLLPVVLPLVASPSLLGG